MSEDKHIIVIGAGAWGTALAIAMARSKYRVTLVTQTHEHTQELKQYRQNKTYLPEIPINPKIEITDDASILKTADILLWVIPTQYTRQLLTNIKSFIPSNIPFVICSKGIDCTQFPVTHESLISVIISKILSNPLSILSGPNFAIEIAQGLPAAATIAAEDLQTASELTSLLSTPLFPLYPNDDLIGVQIAGAVKNVIAIANGILLGRQLGQNAQAALLCRGLEEIKNLGTAMGAKLETFFSLAGMGDFILTCTSNQSRNTSVGIALSQGKTLEQILTSSNSISEGVYTAKAIHSLIENYQVEMPICKIVYRLLEQEISIDTAVQSLTGM